MFWEIERHIRKSNWAEALKATKHLLQDHPSQARLHGYAGLCNFRLEQFESAVDSLRRAVVLDENFWEAGTLLAQALDRLLRFEEALDVVEQFLVVRPSDPTLIHLRNGLQRIVPERITDAWQKSIHLDWPQVELTQSD